MLSHTRVVKNVVLCGTAFGPSGYGQITCDFQTGPYYDLNHNNDFYETPGGALISKDTPMLGR